MPDPYYPPSGFYFRLQTLNKAGSAVAVSPPEDMSFQDAAGISVEIESETAVEGGLNTYRHRLPTTARYGDLVLKRGFVVTTKPLYQWCKSTIEGGFNLTLQPKILVLQLLAPSDNEASPSILRQWSFYGAWPTKWNISEFNSTKNEAVIETLEFAYRFFQAA